MISWLEQVAGELHATFRVRPAAMCARAGCKACGAWLRCQRAVARPGRTTSRRVELPNSDPAPQVWRAPEGPEGTGGLRGAAPNEVRTPSLAGGRALRRPEHPWSHKQPGPVTAGGPPPTGTHSGRAPQSITTERPEHQRRHKQHNNQAPQHHTWHTKNRHPDRMSACGGARGIRTPDLLIANETRYQLRHSPKDSNSLAPSQSATQADHRRVRHDTEPTHATAPRARGPAARHQQLRDPLLGASCV